MIGNAAGENGCSCLLMDLRLAAVGCNFLVLFMNGAAQNDIYRLREITDFQQNKPSLTCS